VQPSPISHSSLTAHFIYNHSPSAFLPSAFPHLPNPKTQTNHLKISSLSPSGKKIASKNSVSRIAQKPGKPAAGKHSRVRTAKSDKNPKRMAVAQADFPVFGRWDE